MAISQKSVGSWAFAASGSVTTTLSTHASGDMMMVRVAYKSSAIETCTASCATAGWDKVGEFHDGTLNSGNGTGSVAVAVFWKVATSASETNPQITFSQAVTQVGHVAVVYQKAASETWDTPVGDGGPHTGGTSFSATIQSHISVIAGDLVDMLYATRDDSSFTSGLTTFTQTGVSFDPAVEYPSVAGVDTSGADGSYDAAYRVANAGSSSAAAVATGNIAATETGSAWQTRLRVSAPRYAAHNAATVVGDSVRRAASRFRSFRRHDELWLPNRRIWAAA